MSAAQATRDFSGVSGCTGATTGVQGTQRVEFTALYAGPTDDSSYLVSALVTQHPDGSLETVVDPGNN